MSPPELHNHLKTVIIAPMTTGSKPAPFRVGVTFEGKQGLILLDQIRTLDQVRLVKRLGKVPPRTLNATLDTLRKVFAP